MLQKDHMENHQSNHPFLMTVERILSMAPKMTSSEKAELEAWEQENLGTSGKGTTDWPGWANVASRLSH